MRYKESSANGVIHFWKSSLLLFEQYLSEYYCDYGAGSFYIIWESEDNVVEEMSGGNNRLGTNDKEMEKNMKKSEESGRFIAVSNKRFFLAEFHFQLIADKFREFRLNHFTVCFAPIDCN